MAITLKKKNFAKGELSADLAIDGLSLTLATNQGLLFPDTGVGNPFRAVLWSASDTSPFADTTREIIECYRSAGDVFTITSRSSESTTAKAWPTGTQFMLTLTSGVLEEIENAITSESLWDRTGTVLSPQNAGDSISGISTYENLQIIGGASSVLDIAASKTVNIDVSVTANGGDITIVGNGTGNTISFPTGVDTLVGCASVDTITGLKTLQHNALATTSHDGLVLTNDTASTAGVPVQISPRQRLRAHVWNTTATAHDETSDWIWENVPTSGTTPTSLLKIGYSANGGAYTYPMTLGNTGLLTVTNLSAYYLYAKAGYGLRNDASSTIFDLNTGNTNASAYISRNTADAYSAFVINNAHASSTGNILDLQWQGSNVAYFTKDGALAIREGGATPSKFSIFQGGDQSIDLTYTLPTGYPAVSGYVLSCTDAGVMSWVENGAGSGATTALDNLASVAINTTLVSDTDNTDALGTTAIAWSDLFLGSGAVITWNSAPSTMNVTLTHSDHALTLSGADATTLALGTNAVVGNLGIHNAGVLTLYEAGDTQNVTLQCNDAEAVATFTGGLDITGEVAFSENITVAGTKKVYLDGGGNTYLQESAGDVMDFYVGGVKAISITENTTAVADFSSMPTVASTSLSSTFAAIAQTFYIGTTQVAINRASAALTLAGITLTAPTCDTSITGSYLTASEILITDADKKIVSAPVATYPSLTELSYVKGVSSAIQTQLGTKAPTASPTFTGTITLADNCRIDLTLPTADTYCTGPTTDSFASGYSSSVGDLVYFGTGGKWLEADADAIATCGTLLGIALEAKADTEAMKVALPGSMVRLDAWNWNVGKCLYASETLGGISESIPTGADGVVKVVGVSLSADAIYFMGSPDHSTVVA